VRIAEIWRYSNFLITRFEVYSTHADQYSLKQYLSKHYFYSQGKTLRDNTSQDSFSSDSSRSFLYLDGNISVIRLRYIVHHFLKFRNSTVNLVFRPGSCSHTASRDCYKWVRLLTNKRFRTKKGKFQHRIKYQFNSNVKERIWKLNDSNI
jgi:hypothetical protein